MPAFACPFRVNFQSHSRDSKHFNTLNMTINTAQPVEHIIFVNFNIQIQFGTFRRGHLATPISRTSLLRDWGFVEIEALLWDCRKSRLGYVYRAGFPNVLIGEGWFFGVSYWTTVRMFA